ncbi:hypothetical protein F383_38675 [Gossypium arboreum]|uniref:Uncharacterized protein n=1 Tax=Gossypium arboreum TaxID=29729 RepID=A0A0B0MLY7_GOSAR|nr:hypothetical protein F383_38675 [Gossypium arboreum]
MPYPRHGLTLTHLADACPRHVLH